LAERTVPLPPGKLPSGLLNAMLERYVRDDPSVIIGPGVGRDAAVLAFGDRALVVKSDPITFATQDAGRYLVNVNANDIACMGATPRWLLVTALLPETSTTSQLVEDLFASLASACDELGILLVGGHSEITIGLERPILVGLMLGDASPTELLDLRRAHPADAVVLCSGIAIEGTAILAQEARQALSSLPPDLLEAATRLIDSPGISVVPAARALRNAGIPVRGLHDPTEGGLMTAVAELAAAAGLGVEVEREQIPVLPETQAICEALDLDPLGLIASGALLAVVPPEHVSGTLDALRGSGINAAHIGTMLSWNEPNRLIVSGVARPLPSFAVDEIARYFARPANEASTHEQAVSNAREPA
jgi:hydrogenase expression/formation protein HypE